jgi:tetratricopeptide (TPR) repeat protein
MKITSTLLFAGCLSLAVSSYAEELSPLDNAISVLEGGQTEKATELFEAQKSNPDAMVYLARIYMNTDLDDAEDWIKKAIQKQPNNAFAQYWKGRVMGAQAQDSVFSALSYAGKSLDGFTRAVELEPSSVQYRNALMQFHIQAPRIAGGDTDIAKQQIAKIKELDAKAGIRAEIDFAFSQDEEEQAGKLLSAAKLTYSDIPDFFFTAGMIQQRKENYAQAMVELTEAIGKQADTEDSVKAKYNAMYQLGRTAVLSETNLEVGIKSLKTYIGETPDVEGLIPKPWAEFRLANLLALNAQKDQAKAIYLRLSNTADKNLAKQAKKAAKKI